MTSFFIAQFTEFDHNNMNIKSTTKKAKRNLKLWYRRVIIIPIFF